MAAKNKDDEDLELIDALLARLAIYNWAATARPNQLTPPGDWQAWLILAGRGFGKTRTGAEQVRRWAKDYRYVNLIGATADDARDIMIDGESGILAVCPQNERPEYLPSKRQLKWPNGAKSLIFTADEPERLRGKQHEKLWGDELGSWRYPEAWDQAMLGLRLGDNPQAIVTTTPRPTKLIRDLIAATSTHVTYGSTYDNRANLAATFFSKIISKYEGTRLGKQELEGKLLDDVVGALWSQSRIDELKVSEYPALTRIVVSIDPAVTSGEDADETGIAVQAKAIDGHAYLLEDISGRYTPLEWAKKAVDALDRWNADVIIGEANNGGDLIESNLRVERPNVPYRKVWASRGKVARAEPVSSLYEQGKVHHVGSFAKLEDELTSMTSDGNAGSASPNRADAVVWGMTELMLGGQTVTFFPEFRGVKRPNEPDNALNIAAIDLPYWWHRWLSAGFGREKTLHWYCQADNGQVHLYRELVLPQELTAQQYGAEVAKATTSELEHHKDLSLWMSEECFEKAAGRSIAEQVGIGIREVLGPDSSFLWEFTPDERGMSEGHAYASMQERRKRLASAFITIQAARSDATGIWSHLRDLIRWRPTTEAPKVEITREMAKSVLAEPDGDIKYFQMVRALEHEEEILPRLLVAECPAAISFLSTAVHDPKRVDDVLVADNKAVADSLRCGMDAHRGTVANKPQEVFVGERLDRAMARNPEMSGDSRHQIATKADRDWQATGATKGFSFRRGRRR